MKTTMKKSIAYLLAVLLVFQIVPVIADTYIVNFQSGDVTFREKLQITADGNATSIAVGMELQLNITDGYEKTKWSSSNETVATVDTTGLVTAHEPGQVRITVEAEGTYADSITLRVIGTSGEKADNEKMIIFINGSKEKITYDGQVHKATYTATSNSDRFDSSKLTMVNEDKQASGKDCNVYTDNLTEEDFKYEGEEAEFVITNGWVQIKPAKVKVQANDLIAREGEQLPETVKVIATSGLAEGETLELDAEFKVDDNDYIMPAVTKGDTIGNYRVETVLPGKLNRIGKQVLYNLAEINGTWYRLAKTEIWTNKVIKNNLGKVITKADYEVNDYDFTDLVITVNGKEYVYKCDKNTEAIFRGANYYTASLKNVEIVKNKIGGMDGNNPRWLIPEEQRYNDPNGTDSIHRNFTIKLMDGAVTATEEQAINMLHIEGVPDTNYYRLKKTTILTKVPSDTVGNNKSLNEREYILARYDFSNVVLTQDGVEYKYCEKVDETENCYTVKLEKVVKETLVNKNQQWYENESGWLDGAKEQYGSEGNEIPCYHINYQATLHKAVEKKVTITSNWPAGKLGYVGTMITLTSHLTGFKDGTYSLQWQYSTDGETWIDQEGATEESLTYELNETTTHYTWRVVVYDVK
jgi:hypothetical protein